MREHADACAPRTCQSLSADFQLEELRLLFLPAIPASSIRAMEDLNARYISEAGKALNAMEGGFHNSIPLCEKGFCDAGCMFTSLS